MLKVKFTGCSDLLTNITSAKCTLQAKVFNYNYKCYFSEYFIAADHADKKKRLPGGKSRHIFEFDQMYSVALYQLLSKVVVASFQNQ